MQIVAVDFDGCLSLGGEWPNTGKPNKPLFDYLKARQHNGDTIILWTCRCGSALDLAVQYCKVNGLVPDYINENVPEMIEKFGNDSRKIYANLYIDDQARTPWSIVNPEKPEKQRREPRTMKILR